MTQKVYRTLRTETYFPLHHKVTGKIYLSPTQCFALHHKEKGKIRLSNSIQKKEEEDLGQEKNPPCHKYGKVSGNPYG